MLCVAGLPGLCLLASSCCAFCVFRVLIWRPLAKSTKVGSWFEPFAYGKFCGTGCAGSLSVTAEARTASLRKHWHIVAGMFAIFFAGPD